MEKPGLQRSYLFRGLLLSASVLVAGCGGDAAEERDAAPGTPAMADRLRDVRDRAEPGQAFYPMEERLAQMREMAPGPEATVRAWVLARRGMARAHLRAGNFGAAAAAADSVLGVLRRSGARPPRAFTNDVRTLLGTAHLRQWLEEHCVEPRRIEACSLPLESAAGGTGEETEGAGDPGRAADLFAGMLSGAPADSVDLTHAWLLNVAHMARGTWPQAVSERWRISPRALEPEAELAPFPDVAPETGVDALGQAGGSVLADFDGDRDLDLMVSSSNLEDPIRYFENRGAEGFVERTRAAGLADLTGGLQLEHADYDNDGNVDVYVLRGGWKRQDVPNSLLENRGDGRFRDVTVEAGLLNPAPTQTAAWGDYDGDGRLDLFVGHETRPEAEAADPSSLYRNQGDGTFREVSGETGLDVTGWVKGAAWGDYDNDGRPDLYVSLMGSPNRLYRNVATGGDVGFREVASEAGVEEPMQSFPTWWFDYDNDGWRDLFVAGYRAEVGDIAAEYLGEPHGAELPRLYRNRGDGTFEDVTRDVDLDKILYAMGSSYGDLNADGHQDMYVGTGHPPLRTLVPSRAFLNDGGERFREVTTVGDFGHLGAGHGVSFGDADADGDQDVSAVFGGANPGDRLRNAFFENPGAGRPWLTLLLEGTGSNRSAIGARVSVELETPAGGRTIHRVVSPGGSFGGNSLRLELGLGDATGVSAVEVRWPASGRTDVHRDLEPNRAYLLREGAGGAEPVEVPATDLTPASGGGGEGP